MFIKNNQSAQLNNSIQYIIVMSKRKFSNIKKAYNLYAFSVMNSSRYGVSMVCASSANKTRQKWCRKSHRFPPEETPLNTSSIIFVHRMNIGLAIKIFMDAHVFENEFYFGFLIFLVVFFFLRKGRFDLVAHSNGALLMLSVLECWGFKWIWMLLIHLLFQAISAGRENSVVFLRVSHIRKNHV